MKGTVESYQFDNSVRITTILYLAIPFLFFLIGWVRLVLSIPFSIMILVSLSKAIRRETMLKKGFSVSFDSRLYTKLIVAWAIIIVWVCFSGIGKLVFQNTDHIWRNTIFNMLVEHDWPVVLDVIMDDGSLQTRGMVYYIGFWLPSALVGKLFSLKIGYLFQIIWASIGIFLVYCHICIYRKKIDLWPLCLFVFFSTIDIIGWIIGYDYGNELLRLGLHIEWWFKFQFSSNTTQLFWVFNQAIPAWLCFIFLVNSKDNGNIVFLLGLLLICSPIPFIGIIPYAAYICLSRNYGPGKKLLDWGKIFFKETITFQNFFGGGISGILTFIYLINNDSGKILGSPTNSVRIINDWLFFLSVEVLVFIVLLFLYNRKNPFYYITSIILIISPLVRLGVGGDFCMRASIPALLMLYLLCINALEIKGYRIVKILLVVSLLLGAATPFQEFARTIMNTRTLAKGDNRYIFEVPQYTRDVQDVLGIYTYLEELPEELLMTGSGNFSGNVKTGLFFKYIARQ